MSKIEIVLTQAHQAGIRAREHGITDRFDTFDTRQITKSLHIEHWPNGIETPQLMWESMISQSFEAGHRGKLLSNVDFTTELEYIKRLIGAEEGKYHIVLYVNGVTTLITGRSKDDLLHLCDIRYFVLISPDKSKEFLQ